jgi:hypothetical protein
MCRHKVDGVLAAATLVVLLLLLLLEVATRPNRRRTCLAKQRVSLKAS